MSKKEYELKYMGQKCTPEKLLYVLMVVLLESTITYVQGSFSFWKVLHFLFVCLFFFKKLICGSLVFFVIILLGLTLI